MLTILLICSEYMSTIQYANDRELAKIQKKKKKKEFTLWFYKKVYVYFTIYWKKSIFAFAFNNNTNINLH